MILKILPGVAFEIAGSSGMVWIILQPVTQFTWPGLGVSYVVFAIEVLIAGNETLK